MPADLTKDDHSLLTPIGRFLSARIIPHLSPAVMPNHVTLFGFACWLGVGIAFYLASFASGWLLVAAVCTFIHWLTDELDGELARERQLTSERGFFLDFYSDCVGGAVIGFGLANASYTIDPLVTFYFYLYLLGVVLTACSMLLRNRMVVSRFGPSEAQAMLIVLALLTFVWPGPITSIAGWGLGWFDLALVFLIPLGLGEWLLALARMIRELDPPVRQIGDARAHSARLEPPPSDRQA